MVLVGMVKLLKVGDSPADENLISKYLRLKIAWYLHTVLVAIDNSELATQVLQVVRQFQLEPIFIRRI